MLHAFGQHVAMCCDMLDVVGSSLKMVKVEPATSPNVAICCVACCDREFNILLVTSSLANQVVTFSIRTQAKFYCYTMVCCLHCSCSTHVLPMVLLGLVVSFSSLLQLRQAWDVVRFSRSNLMTYQSR